MDAERGPARESPAALAPSERGEHWWPAATAMIVVAGSHAALPATYRVRPVWLFPAVVLALVAVLFVGDPGRIDRRRPWMRVTVGAVIALITVANLFGAVRLVADILPITSSSLAIRAACSPPAP
jgi:hypothetical protein